jgi:hypothetical protein
MTVSAANGGTRLLFVVGRKIPGYGSCEAWADDRTAVYSWAHFS